MHDSLSIVFRVRNAESTLARDTAELLDVLADLTTRFEVVIVDEGSTDHTEDAAVELSRRFPQVRLPRAAPSEDAAGAEQRGVNDAEGEIVMVVDGRGDLPVSDLQRLWALRGQRGPSRLGAVRMARCCSGDPQPPANTLHGKGKQSGFRRADAASPRIKSPRAPNFLSHLKSLALGE